MIDSIFDVVLFANWCSKHGTYMNLQSRNFNSFLQLEKMVFNWLGKKYHQPRNMMDLVSFKQPHWPTLNWKYRKLTISSVWGAIICTSIGIVCCMSMRHSPNRFHSILWQKNEDVVDDICLRLLIASSFTPSTWVCETGIIWHIPIIYPSYTHHIPIIYPSYTHHIPIIYPSYTHHIPIIYPCRQEGWWLTIKLRGPDFQDASFFPGKKPLVGFASWAGIIMLPGTVKGSPVGLLFMTYYPSPNGLFCIVLRYFVVDVYHLLPVQSVPTNTFHATRRHVQRTLTQLCC